MENKNCDTIIIGAGLSGLCAASQLKKYGEKVLVLEARDRVGGRTYTVKDADHGSIDLGGAYVGPTQNRIYRLCKELDLKLYNIDEKDYTVMDLKSCWGKFKGSVPPFWNPFKLLDINHFIRTFDSMAKQVPPEAPWTARKARQWDSISVAQFIDQILWTRSAREVAEILMRSIFCVELTEISLLSALWYFNSGGGILRLGSVTNGAQEKKVVGGTQQISEGLARLLGDNVKLRTPVVHVKYDAHEATVIDAHGNIYQARYVISSVPQPLLNRIEFDPPLPWERIQLMQRMPMGSIIKTVMFYKTQFWRNLDLNGIAMSSDGVCCYCLDDTKPNGQHPAIMGFILADRAREMANATPDVRKQALCAYYAWVFGCDDFLHPVDYREYNWMADQYSGGCYSSVMPPRVLTHYGRCLREPVGRVYFAGTETATMWAGYMDGAVQAGERAANQILFADGKISSHEVDPIEPESLEYPALPIPFSYIEHYLPSNTALLRFGVAITLGFIGFSAYVFFYSWKGALFWKWFQWRYDLDEKDMWKLSKYFRIPSRFYKHVTGF